jgi:four helix bundle protein
MLMTAIQSHRDLMIWNKAMDLEARAYEIVRLFPTSERYGLVSQLTRAAVSVPANIAEGHARPGAREYTQFVSVAKGSLMEVETYVLIAIRSRYVTNDAADPVLRLITEISKMLTALRKRLLAKS